MTYVRRCISNDFIQTNLHALMGLTDNQISLQTHLSTISPPSHSQATLLSALKVNISVISFDKELKKTN